MEQYNVTGMSCAACSARVEKAVSKVPGVTSCSVSLLTNSMGVEGTAAPADIVAAVEAAGYGASPKNAAAQSAAPSADALKDTETPRPKRRLIASLILWVVLMYFSMGHMWGAPMPRWLHHNSVGMGLIQLLLAGIVLQINADREEFKSLVTSAPALSHPEDRHEFLHSRSMFPGLMTLQLYRQIPLPSLEVRSVSFCCVNRLMNGCEAKVHPDFRQPHWGCNVDIAQCIKK